MMSSSGFRPFDELPEQYEDEWLQLGLDDETLKCSSPPANGTSDFGLTVATRSCPSPLSHIPTREPYSSDPPPKLSPVSTEQQTFITLSNSRISSIPHGPTQPVLQPPPETHSSELTSIEYELNPDLNVLSIPSSSPLLATKSTELQFAQPSVSDIQQSGDFASFVQLEQRGKRTVIQPQHHTGCVQAVNGQWFVQAQVQHVQTSAGTVIAVVPNFCRPQHSSGGNQPVPQVQVSQPQLIAHSVGSGQTLSAATQPAGTQLVVQSHPHHQVQQQPQQLIHSARVPNSLTVGVTSGTPQQGQSVMQHLLSQPTISRPQQTAVQTVSIAPTTTRKQRNTQPRNGRKKNSNQGGTLGAVLAKANKLAAAASTDASLNQLLPPSHGIEMRLSVQNSEQVANLSKEISRLQNLQATYNVDHSAEIKDLENKRAQIFFEALAQQHKDKDLLSAVNAKPLTPVPVGRQRNHNKNNHNNTNAAVVIHQVQPSTSYEQQQQQLNFEPVTTARVPVSYQNSYQLSHYAPTLETLQNNSFSSRTNSQVPTTQYASYRTTVNQSLVRQNQVRENYMHSMPAVLPQQTIIMHSERRSPRLVLEVPSEPNHTPVPLFPPPILRSSVEAAACINEKKFKRARRISDYFSSMHTSTQHPDMTSPFIDLSDVLHRLLPYHAYLEPNFNSEALDIFDHNCLRHFVHLYNRKNFIENRIRSLLHKEAMEGHSKTDECLLLSLDAEYERHLLDDEKRTAAATSKGEFMNISTICSQMSAAEMERRQKELAPKSIPKLQFEYRAFSENEIAARAISPFTDSEDEKPSGSATLCNEDAMLFDLINETSAPFDATKTIAVEGIANRCERRKSTETVRLSESKNMVGNEWTNRISSPDLSLKSANCNTRSKSSSLCSYQNFCSPDTAYTPKPIVEKKGPRIKSKEQVEAIIALAHAASLERISSPVTAEENESIENCVPTEDAGKNSETEVMSCDNDSLQNLENKSTKAENNERPPIRLKIALTDAGLKNCFNKSGNKKNKKKKKRKHHDSVKACNREVNGVLPSCSGLEQSKCEAASSCDDNVSHPRLLMRITRKNNIVSVADPLTNHISLRITPKVTVHDQVDEQRSPPLKVPKLKIRFGQNRVEQAVSSGKSLPSRGPNSGVPCELNRLKMNIREGVVDKHKNDAQSGQKMKIFVPKSVITNSFSYGPSSSVATTVNSSAQFSPTSELSDEEADKQLRAQADTVISRLNDWGTERSVPNRSESLSRLVAAAPLVNPVLDRLLPSNSWFFNMDVKNHSTVTTSNTDNTASSPEMPWLVSTTSLMQQTAAMNQTRGMKTALGANKSH